MAEPNKITKCRKIVAEHQHAKVEGTRVDAFSASAIIAVYDALNEENREKFVAFPIAKMARIAFKLVK